MIKFRSIDQLLQSEQGILAKQRFIQIGIILKQYEDELYTKWLEDVSKLLPIYLKQNLLIDVEQQPDIVLSDHSPMYRLPLYLNQISISNDHLSHSIVDKLKFPREKCQLHQYVYDPMGTKNKIEIKYLINSNSNLKESLNECYYLEKLGFHLPEFLIQITLQSSKFQQLFDKLYLILEDYHLTFSSLNTIEISLLQSYLNQLQNLIQQGTSRISFGEINTIDYINQCQNQLEQLHTILNQIRNISENIQEHLEYIRLCVIDSIVPQHDDGMMRVLRKIFE